MSSILADSLARAAQQSGPLPTATAPSALFKNQQVICVGTRVLRHMTQNASSKYPSQFINRLKQAISQLFMEPWYKQLLVILINLTEEFDPGSD